MILHIVTDDKFTDYAISQFETVAPGKNRFVSITYIDNYLIKYIQQKEKVDLISVYSPAFETLCKNLTDYKAIIMHNLHTWAQEYLIKSAPTDVKIAWAFWGSEIYGRKKYIKRYLGTQTHFIFNKYLLKQYIKRIYRRVTSGEKYVRIHEIGEDMFKRVNYCLTDIYEDFIAAQEILKTKFQWAWYNYYTIEDTIGDLKDSFVNGSNILLGNSASITNNYLEAFGLLEKFDLGTKKIITPLSYGEEYYRNIVIEQGKSRFGEHFFPLIDYLDRKEYNKYILSCNVVIMNHYRPQAFGNILTALWLGSKVYLSKRNLIYSYLTRLGLRIYSIEDDLKPGNPDALISPDHTDILYNREILYSEYGKESVLIRVRKVINLLEN